MSTDLRTDHYAALHAGFRWQVPERFNLAEVCAARWARATPDAIAIRYEHENGRRAFHTYGEIQRDADRLAHALVRLGVQRGDRVAVVMPQRVETAVANLAVWRVGAVAMPLSMLFGPDALEYRLQHSEAGVAIVDESAIANLRLARPACAGPAARRGGRRGERAGRRRLGRRARPRRAALCAGRHARRRGGGADLHERHDRPAEGRADPAPRADRQPLRLRLQPELVPAARRRVLVAGRLGLDRRPDGRAAADALLRPRDRRLPGPLRARAGVRAHGPPRRHATPSCSRPR